MRVSYKWLKEYVDVPYAPKELASQLTLRGVAVEAVEDLNKGIEGVVSGRILTIEPHPAADALVVCRVEVGRTKSLTIVTGAPDIRVGDVVPVAAPGSSLPGGWRIEAAELRGVLSEGMLCSETELMEGQPHKETEGLWILPPGTPVGRPMTELLALDDWVLELDLTPNYASHCLNMIGVAREVAAITGGEVRLPSPPATTAAGEAAEMVRVTIEAPDLCSRYTARLLRDVRPGQSPLWLQNRLRAAGMRPVSTLVDITNYVMLELGQPLHAFDYKTIAGRRIVVRRARPGETMVTLDGQERSLDPETLVIADASRPSAIAGVMGGLDSEVSEAGAAGPATETVLLESAHFDNRSVRRTSRQLGLSSEAATRFIKGTDVNATVLAADRACELAVALGAATPVPGAVDVYPGVETPRLIPLRPGRVSRLLGLSLSREAVMAALGRLGLKALTARDLAASGAPMVSAALALWEASPGPLAADARKDWEQGIGLQIAAAREKLGDWGDETLFVVVPTRRPDLMGETDLVEEVARIDGYEHIPATLPTGTTTAGGRTEAQELSMQAREILLGLGYTQVVPYSFESPAEVDRLGLPVEHPWRRQLRIQNPFSEDYSVMRTTLLTSLLGVLRHNQAWRQGDVQIFKLGSVFQPRSLPVTELPEEKWKVGIAATGLLQPKVWNRPEGSVDFFAVKGAVEALLDSLGCPAADYVPSAYPFLHPGRQAEVRVGGGTQGGSSILGFVGELHPLVAQNYDLPNRVVVAELDWLTLTELAGTGRHYTPIGRYPAVVRDVALVLPVSVPASLALSVIRATGGALLQDARLFDIYEGKNIPAGKRSLAYTLTYRAEDHTLTEAEVESAHGAVRQALAEELGAELRS